MRTLHSLRSHSIVAVMAIGIVANAYIGGMANAQAQQTFVHSIRVSINGRDVSGARPMATRQINPNTEFASFRITRAQIAMAGGPMIGWGTPCGIFNADTVGFRVVVQRMGNTMEVRFNDY